MLTPHSLPLHTTEAGTVPFSHALHCPTLLLEQRGTPAVPSAPAHWLRVGVTVLLEHNERVLVTRRSAHLRSFPNRWVVPGAVRLCWVACVTAVKHIAHREDSLCVTRRRPLGSRRDTAGCGCPRGWLDKTHPKAPAGSHACAFDCMQTWQLEEETGVTVGADSLQLHAVWESVFHYSLEVCVRARCWFVCGRCLKAWSHTGVGCAHCATQPSVSPWHQLGPPSRQHMVMYMVAQAQTPKAGGASATASSSSGAGGGAGAAAAAATSAATASALPLKLQTSEVA